MPYGDLVRRAAQCGGPDEFVNQISRKNYTQGKHDGLMNLAWAVPTAISLLKGAELVAKRVFQWYQFEKHERKKGSRLLIKDFENNWKR